MHFLQIIKKPLIYLLYLDLTNKIVVKMIQNFKPNISTFI